MGDKYQLFHGDCLEIIPTLPPASVDAIITDLPYGTTQNSWDEIIPFDAMWKIIKHVLKPRGVFVTTASQPFTSKLVMSNLEWFKYEWIWSKNTGTRFLDANRKPLNYHDNILIFSDSQCTYNPQKYKGERNHSSKISIGKTYPKNVYGNFTGVAPNRDGIKYPKSIIDFNRVSPDEFSHPSQKPVSLYEYLIRTYTNPGETVMDFTMGSCTTGVACMRTGRKFIGVELLPQKADDPDYFSIARQRIEAAARQPPLFVETSAPRPEYTQAGLFDE